MKFKKLNKNSEKKIVNLKNNNTTPQLINFNSTWCHWSKKLEPVWNELKEKMFGNDIEIIDFKCDINDNQGVCNKYQIMGYPTIKLIVGDNIIDYDGDRSLESFIKFIEENVDY